MSSDGSANGCKADGPAGGEATKSRRESCESSSRDRGAETEMGPTVSAQSPHTCQVCVFFNKSSQQATFTVSQTWTWALGLTCEYLVVGPLPARLGQTQPKLAKLGLEPAEESVGFRCSVAQVAVNVEGLV